jgi:tRNA (cmo5U34)-methyltransferase
MKDWTFDEFAQGFDSHVREQLPWYELVTTSVAFIVRNYLRREGLVYDIGCSTGNMTMAMMDVVEERDARIIGIEPEKSMVQAYSRFLAKPNVTVCQEFAEEHNYDSFDVAVVMLTAMFIPVFYHKDFLETLYYNLNVGGAIIIVDKVTDESGYFSTVMKRLTMFWKLENGAKPEEILSKELSLSGVQRPLDPKLLRNYKAKQFFQLGEFKGWVIEK